jgi:hypothetical protein
LGAKSQFAFGNSVCTKNMLSLKVVWEEDVDW